MAGTQAANAHAAPGHAAAPTPQGVDGWQLAYSKTRKRWYYFNTNGNRAFFEPPGVLERCTGNLLDLQATCNALLIAEAGHSPVNATEYQRWLKQARPRSHAHPDLLLCA